jgi:hypothetical protein
MSNSRNEYFVNDGCERARVAAMEKVRTEVEQEYAGRLASTNWWQRLLLRREMRREIEKRLDAKAPPWGLYLSERS